MSPLRIERKRKIPLKHQNTKQHKRILINKLIFRVPIAIGISVFVVKKDFSEQAQIFKYFLHMKNNYYFYKTISHSIIFLLKKLKLIKYEEKFTHSCTYQPHLHQPG